MESRIQYYKSRIIGGKLVSTPTKSDSRYSLFENNHVNSANAYTEFCSRPLSVPGIPQRVYENVVTQNRAEAQRNKARALAQTYSSVLSPEPVSRFDQPLVLSDSLAVPVAHSLGTISRHKLVLALSALRRLDPDERGILSVSEISDVLSLYHISLEKVVLQQLLARHRASENKVNYKSFWQFLLECYAYKDRLDLPTKDTQFLSQDFFSRQLCTSDDKQFVGFRQNSTRPVVRNADRSLSKASSLMNLSLQPGLKAELDYEFRHCAREHQRFFHTAALQCYLEKLDPFRSGKLLHEQMIQACDQFLQGISCEVLESVLVSCDLEKDGYVSYELFLKHISESQTPHFPPIGSGATNLASRSYHQTPSSPKMFSENHEEQLDGNVLLNSRDDFSTYLLQHYTPTKSELHSYSDLNANSLIPHFTNVEKRPNLSQISACSGTSESVSRTGKSFCSLDFPSIPTTPVETDLTKAAYCSDRLSPLISVTTAPSVNKAVRCKSPLFSRLPPDATRTFNRASEHVAGGSHSVVRRSSSRRLWHDADLAFNSNMKLKVLPQTGGSKTVTHADSSKSQSFAVRAGKWWQNEAPVCDAFVHSKRMTWLQSKPVSTFRVRKKRRKILKKKHVSSVKEIESDSDWFTPSASDADVYTTTDLEVGSTRLLVADRLAHRLDSIDISELESESEDAAARVPWLKGGGRRRAASKCKHVLNHKKMNESKQSATMSSCDPPSIPVVDKEGNSRAPNDIAALSPILHSEGNALPPLQDSSPKDLSNTPPNAASCAGKLNGVPLDVISISIGGRIHDLHPPRFLRSSSWIDRDGPSENLSLEWVYGYDGKDRLSNLLALASNELVYTAGMLAIILDVAHRCRYTQRYYQMHDHTITCICIHPDGVTVASGQKAQPGDEGSKALIRIWNSVDLSTVAVLVAPSAAASHIQSVDFCRTGSGCHLAVIEENKTSFLSVFDWKNSRLIASREAGEHRVLGVIWSPLKQEKIVTYGKWHVTFWTFHDDELTSEKACFGDYAVPKQISCAVFDMQGDLLAGDSNGSICIWRDGSVSIDHVIDRVHSGAIDSLCFTGSGYLISGSGKDANMHVCDAQTRQPKQNLPIHNRSSGCRSMVFCSSKLYVGTSCNSILQLDVPESNLLDLPGKASLAVLTEGHGDTVSAIAAHPSEARLLSACCDGNVFLHDADAHKVVWKTQIKGNSSSCAFLPAGGFALVSCQDGSLHLLQAADGVFVDKFKKYSCCVTCTSFSPDGTMLAVGHLDGRVAVFLCDMASRDLEFKQAEQLCSSAVEAIDWSMDGALIRVQSTIDEFSICQVNTMKEEALVSRNAEWQTERCSVTYQMSGMWQAHEERLRQSHASVTVSPSKELAVINIGPSKELLLTPYPWTNRQARFRSIVAADDPITDFLFSHDGRRLFVVTDSGGCIYQWRMRRGDVLPPDDSILMRRGFRPQGAKNVCF